MHSVPLSPLLVTPLYGCVYLWNLSILHPPCCPVIWSMTFVSFTAFLWYHGTVHSPKDLHFRISSVSSCKSYILLAHCLVYYTPCQVKLISAFNMQPTHQCHSQISGPIIRTQARQMLRASVYSNKLEWQLCYLMATWCSTTWSNVVFYWWRPQWLLNVVLTLIT